jgi:hypothetical protein
VEQHISVAVSNRAEGRRYLNTAQNQAFAIREAVNIVAKTDHSFL